MRLFHDPLLNFRLHCRGGSIPADGSGPIYVCTRNDALKSVIDGCPANRRGDLVFYGQNGYIEDFLRKEGLFGQVTQVPT